MTPEHYEPTSHQSVSNDWAAAAEMLTGVRGILAMLDDLECDVIGMAGYVRTALDWQRQALVMLDLGQD